MKSLAQIGYEATCTSLKDSFGRMYPTATWLTWDELTPGEKAAYEAGVMAVIEESDYRRIFEIADKGQLMQKVQILEKPLARHIELE